MEDQISDLSTEVGLNDSLTSHNMQSVPIPTLDPYLNGDAKSLEVDSGPADDDNILDFLELEYYNETDSSFDHICGNQSESEIVGSSHLNFNVLLGNETLYNNNSGSTRNDSPSSLWTSEGHNLDLSNWNTQQNQSDQFCQIASDDILCWPKTLAKTTATLPCFPELNGIPYDTSRNATRYCDESGTWDWTDYKSCVPLKTPTTDHSSLDITTGVYFYGYCLSLGALIVAIIIFLGFKELRCLRNRIHTHLIATYILADAMWIITSSTTFTATGQDPQTQPGQSNRISCVTFIMLHYFHLTNFFWSFVEGLYLYVLVVQTFFAQENVRLRVFAFIGWGVPLLIVIGWMIAKFASTPSTASEIQSTDPDYNVYTCLWLTISMYDWIYKTPVILVLAANMLFLVQIMWVLITKLRSATNQETRQSRKAAKALLVLMPLLGITYVLILSGSKTPVYEHLRAFLISTQGFLVSLLFCFFNGEVKASIRSRWIRLRIILTNLTLCDCQKQQKIQRMRAFDSPQTLSESIRLCNTPSSRAPSLGKRDSSAYEISANLAPAHVCVNNRGNETTTLIVSTHPASTQKLLHDVVVHAENNSSDE